MLKNNIEQYLHKNSFFKDPNSGVWTKETISPFAYSDGDDAENYIFNIINNASDLTVYSEELKSKMKDWASTYHLSARRSNLLWPFRQFFTGKRVLEIGCGCGAISRFLGESGAQLTSVEGSIRRAQIARARCRDLRNVEVICSPSEQLPDLGQFDIVLLIGVLEYARIFIGPQGQSKLLQDCYNKLSEDGHLFVAIENKLGIKYFAGANEDHLGQPMLGINNNYASDGVATFGREELLTLLDGNGFQSVEEYIPLPDYKLPISIVTPLGIKQFSRELTSLAVESVCMDAQGVSNYLFSLEEATKNIWQNDLAPDLSNSFLMLAAKKAMPSNITNNIAAFHFSSERKPQFSKVTAFLNNETNELAVLSEKLRPSNQNHYDLLQQTIEQAAFPFIQGSNLWLKLVNIVNTPNWSIEDVTAWTKNWIDTILDHAKISIIYNKDLNISSKYIDATPLNIMESPDNQFYFFDFEWKPEDAEIKLGYLVFRGLFNSLSRITSFASTNNIENIENTPIIQMTSEIMKQIGFDITPEDQTHYIKKYAEFSAMVYGNDQDQLIKESENIVFRLRKTPEEYKKIIHNQIKQLKVLQEQLDSAQQQIQAIYNSNSWKLTSPIRKFFEYVHKIKK